MDRLQKLRQEGQRLAEEFGETVLLIEDPPATEILGFKSVIPCLVLDCFATAAEKEAAIQTFVPVRKP